MRGNTNRRGAVCVWVVVSLLVLVGFAGLATDAALIVLVGQQLQVGADAAALAGARLVRSDVPQARVQAINVARANKAGNKIIELDANGANADSGDIVAGHFDRDTQLFTAQLTNINALKVVARRTDGSLGGSLPLVFGPIFRVTRANVQRTAIAMVGGGTGAGMIVLDPDDPKALYVRGSAIVNVSGGDIQVNSNSSTAVDLQGSKFIVDAPNLNIVGDVTMGGGDIGSTQINPNSPFIPDPLAYIPEPTWNASNDLGAIAYSSGTHTVSPGYYSGGLSLSGGDITLQPGLYILGGAGLDIRGNVNVTGNNVMFFVDSGPVGINGTGSVVFTPPDPATASYPGVDTYEGLLIFQARDNPTSSLINGTSGLDLSGTIYFPDAHTTLSGTSDKLGTQFVANTIEIAGNSNLTINYNGAFPAPGNKVFLVK